MKISAVYDKYRINKGLREHMLRVAAVAKMICDNSTGDIETRKIVTACLVHDIGNIVKTKFDLPAELFEPEGIEYHKKVQEEYFEKYGRDDHEVTVAIVSEIGVGQEIIDLLGATGPLRTSETHEKGTLGQKIVMYSDCRVDPHGIVALDDRFNELARRTVPHKYSEELISTSRAGVHDFEQEIFERSKISPEDINDESTKEIQKELLDWDIV